MLPSLSEACDSREETEEAAEDTPLFTCDGIDFNASPVDEAAEDTDDPRFEIASLAPDNADENVRNLRYNGI